MKLFVVYILSIVCLLNSLCGCTKEKQSVTINLEILSEFNENKNFTVFSAVPPEPNAQALQTYVEAGFTNYVLTEDWLTMTNADRQIGTKDDGAITQAYVDAINICKDMGLNVYVCNCRSDPDWFVNDYDGVRYMPEPWGYEYQLPKRNITTEFSQMSGVTGYVMGDELGWKQIGGYEKLIDWYNEYGGNKTWHLNLLQSYGSWLFEDENGAMYDFQEYVDYYCATILEKINGPKTISTDYYPLVSGGDAGDNYVLDGYLYDYFIIANKAKELKELGHDVTTNFCVQSYERATELQGYARKLTSKADIAFQVNVAMAFGASSLCYYTYCSFGEELGIFDTVSGLPSKIYPWVKQVNAEAHDLADVILNFNWQGAKVYAGAQGGNTTDEYTTIAFDKVKDLTLDNFILLSSVTARLDTVVSEFKDLNGNVGYMVVNYSEPSKNLTDNVLLKFSQKTNKVLICKNGEISVSSVNGNSASISLQAGEGAFIYPIISN